MLDQSFDVIVIGAGPAGYVCAFPAAQLGLTAALIAAPTTRAVKGAKENVQIKAKNIVIATGSAPVELPFMKFDGETIVSSDHAIALSEVPKKLVVVGGGAIGLELGSVWSRLGSDVT